MRRREARARVAPKAVRPELVMVIAHAPAADHSLPDCELMQPWAVLAAQARHISTCKKLLCRPGLGGCNPWQHVLVSHQSPWWPPEVNHWSRLMEHDIPGLCPQHGSGMPLAV